MNQIIGRCAEAMALWALVLCLAQATAVGASDDARLPEGVRAVWDLSKADRQSTPTRERICINGLWRWQPAKDLADAVPEG